MVDFRTLLSGNQVALIAATQAEMARLHGLADRWLARELLRLARCIRSESPSLASPLAPTYESRLVWHVAPELARRLGEPSLLANEATRDGIRGIGGMELRLLAASCLRNGSLARAYSKACKERTRPCAAELLAQGVANGNAVAIAADRVCAPAPHYDERDYMANAVREVSRCRGLPEMSAWSPAMDAYERRPVGRPPMPPPGTGDREHRIGSVASGPGA